MEWQKRPRVASTAGEGESKGKDIDLYDTLSHDATRKDMHMHVLMRNLHLIHPTYSLDERETAVSSIYTGLDLAQF